MDAVKDNLDLEYGLMRRRVAIANMNLVLKGNYLPAAFFLIVIASHTLAQRRPVDYVNPLIGTAPITDKEYLGNNPAPGEELYSGTVNPCAMVPDPDGYLCVGPVTGFDGVYHVRGSGYRSCRLLARLRRALAAEPIHLRAIGLPKKHKMRRHRRDIIQYSSQPTE